MDENSFLKISKRAIEDLIDDRTVLDYIIEEIEGEGEITDEKLSEISHLSSRLKIIVELNTPEKKVSITEEEYDKMQESSNFLMALEAAGVDNWDGYDIAQGLLEEWENE